MNKRAKKAITLAAAVTSLGTSLGVAPVDAQAAVDMFLQQGKKDSVRESTQGKIESTQGKIESTQGKISNQEKHIDPVNLNKNR
ncbi:MAG: hypothetical protein OQK67_02460 [Chlorobium sp.]|nr:hypothetical protein [Chlorobium sp.]MCW8814778.1 hypothetical protein [Chlorobium sp.]MCW8820135.1 hypothetical protein [Ignavibacteriaceae bacterium]